MKNTMSYKGFFGSVRFSADDDCLHGKVLGIGDLVSYDGSGVEELRERFREAVDDYLALCAQRGVEPERVYRGTFNVRISPELHRQAAFYAESNHETLNHVVEQAIRRYVAE